MHVHRLWSRGRLEWPTAIASTAAMEPRNVKKGASIPDGDSQEAATDDTTDIDDSEVRTKVHDAIMQVRGLASDVARALAAALCAATVQLA